MFCRDLVIDRLPHLALHTNSLVLLKDSYAVQECHGQFISLKIFWQFEARRREADEMIAAAQVSIPLWALVHLPVVVTVTTAVFTPKASRSLPSGCCSATADSFRKMVACTYLASI